MLVLTENILKLDLLKIFQQIGIIIQLHLVLSMN